MLLDYDKSEIEPGRRMAELGPEPVEPGGGSWSLGKGCLILAGIIMVLLVLGLGIGGYFLYTKAGELTGELFEKSKSEVLGYLADDLTEEERAEVERVYEEMVQELKTDGLFQFALQHGKSMEVFSEITADKRITKEESERWVQEWNKEQAQPVAPEPSP